VPQSNESYRKILEKLEGREKENLLRSLQPISFRGSKTSAQIGSSVYLNFCSNDYLGLSEHPEMIRRSNDYTTDHGTSSSASRLVSGSMKIHHRLEDKITALYNTEASLVFGNGFMANTTILPALAGRGDLLLADKRCHNSIVQGGLLSRASFRRFSHNDCNHLEELLKRHRGVQKNNCWVITESLFSMDGDFAPLDEISDLCRQYEACLMVDDAHAFGVWGKEGLGMINGREEVDLGLGTMGKAGGCYGAFVLSSEIVKEYLINYCTGIIYSTAPAPSQVGAMEAAFDLIPNLGNAREKLKMNIDYLSSGLEQLGFDTGGSRSQIIPVLLGSEKEALGLASRLFHDQIYVQAIRPPTVESSRLRITLSALHTREDLNRLLEVMKHA
jgi:8-amino-7-oxononanoate synthase